MQPTDRVYVAGHSGLVGSALVRELSRLGYQNILTRTHHELDLTNQEQVTQFFREVKPEYVFHAAGLVGGIVANERSPGFFAYENTMMAANVIHAAALYSKKTCVLGSSCIYPRDCPQPIKEEYLLSGPLEGTNRAYAVAKIAGISMAQAYAKQFDMNVISPMPTNLYGPEDNFDLESSHVLPALIRKFHDAKESVTLWGSGTPRREFLHVDDLASALVFLMEHYDSPDLINVGTGVDHTIQETAELVARIVGFQGAITWDTSKPDGTPRKLLDVSKLHALGWHHTIGLEDGIRSTYEWFRKGPT